MAELTISVLCVSVTLVNQTELLPSPSPAVCQWAPFNHCWKKKTLQCKSIKASQKGGGVSRNTGYMLRDVEVTAKSESQPSTFTFPILIKIIITLVQSQI